MDNVTQDEGVQVVVYEDAEGEIKVEVWRGREMVRMSLKELAALFTREKSFISRLLRDAAN